MPPSKLYRCQSSMSKESPRPKVSILLISWNRPYCLWLTLKSITRSLYFSILRGDIEIVLLDQGSSNKATYKIIKVFNKFLAKLILLDKNIGIAEGWKLLSEHAGGAYILNLENDWWCSTYSDNWIWDALSIISIFDLPFIKLRALKDVNDFGYGFLDHAGWTHKNGTTKTYFKGIGKEFILAKKQEISFSFNPQLHTQDFYHSLIPYLFEDKNSVNPKQSGENSPQMYWKNQTQHLYSGTLCKGPFKHVGFYSLFHKLTLFPLYLLYEVLILELIARLERLFKIFFHR